MQGKDCDKSSAIYFYADTNKSWGWHTNFFDNIIIRNAYNGIYKEKNEVVWNTVFRDIRMWDIYHQAINLLTEHGGQLGNIFENISILNYSRNEDNLNLPNDNSVCIAINGEFSFNRLDIEDWYGKLFLTEDGHGSINNVHIERSVFDDNNIGKIFVCYGTVDVNHISMTYTKARRTKTGTELSVFFNNREIDKLKIFDFRFSADETSSEGVTY